MPYRNMPIPEIKGYFCSDIPDIDTWIPEEPEYVDFWLQVTIGTCDSNAADIFQVHVVSQSSLSHIEDKRYLLVIPFFEGMPKVIEALAATIEQCQDIDWAGISSKLSKLYHWEYEDYNL